MDLKLSDNMKRASEGVEGNSVVKKVKLGDEIGEISGSRNAIDVNDGDVENVEVDEHLYGKSNVVIDKNDENRGQIGVAGDGECHNSIQVLTQNLGNVNRGNALGFDLNVPVMEGNAKEGNALGFDINIPVMEQDDWGNLVGLQEFHRTNVELSEVSSYKIDQGKDREHKQRDEGNNKRIEEIRPYNVKLEIGGSSQFERRFTEEEKGKAKVDNSWLSLTNSPMKLEVQHREPQPEAVAAVPQLGSVPRRQTFETFDPIAIQNEIRRRAIEEHEARELAALRRRAHHFARCDAGSSSQDKKLPTVETIEDLANATDPFSVSLKRIMERIPRRKDEKLVRWQASPHSENKSFSRASPSLLDLSLRALAENAEAIVSLQGVPDFLRQRLTELLCDSRKMNTHMLDLLVRGSPTQIRLKDCSWLTEKQFRNSFRGFDRRHLMVLQLDLCGQCTLDCLLGETIAPSSNSLPNLAILSLRGACRMSDKALKTLVTSAPSLQSIDLAQCSLLTHTGINIAARSLRSILKELYIDNCQNIDAIHILPALKEFEHLEVLSVAGIDSVCDEFVSNLLTSHGQNLKELDFSDCQNLSDQFLKFIGAACANLRSLNISNLSKLTDRGLRFLANGCRSIRRLKLCRNSFSDEGIAAFLEASGVCLEELSLNHCKKVSTNTAFSLAKSSRTLLYLDLSWCRKLTDEELGLIVDSCLSLKLLKLFGCTQVTNVFINGHSNTVVQIVGLTLTPGLDKISWFDAVEVLLKYSPILTSSNS